MSNCGCGSDQAEKLERKTLIVLLAINAVMFFAEIILGFLAESTGLIADSLDMLADAGCIRNITLCCWKRNRTTIEGGKSKRHFADNSWFWRNCRSFEASLFWERAGKFSHYGRWCSCAYSKYLLCAPHFEASRCRRAHACIVDIYNK